MIYSPKLPFFNQCFSEFVLGSVWTLGTKLILSCMKEKSWKYIFLKTETKLPMKIPYFTHGRIIEEDWQLCAKYSFSFNSYVYCLTTEFNASTSAFNLLIRAFLDDLFQQLDRIIEIFRVNCCIWFKCGKYWTVQSWTLSAQWMLGLNRLIYSPKLPFFNQCFSEFVDSAWTLGTKLILSCMKEKSWKYIFLKTETKLPMKIPCFTHGRIIEEDWQLCPKYSFFQYISLLALMHLFIY